MVWYILAWIVLGLINLGIYSIAQSSVSDNMLEFVIVIGAIIEILIVLFFTQWLPEHVIFLP